jgi:WD40 repeat protein
LTALALSADCVIQPNWRNRWIADQGSDRGDGGLFFTGKEDETARIWDARTGEPIGIGGPENFLRRAR